MGWSPIHRTIAYSTLARDATLNRGAGHSAVHLEVVGGSAAVSSSTSRSTLTPARAAAGLRHSPRSGPPPKSTDNL